MGVASRSRWRSARWRRALACLTSIGLAASAGCAAILGLDDVGYDSKADDASSERPLAPPVDAGGGDDADGSDDADESSDADLRDALDAAATCDPSTAFDAPVLFPDFGVFSNQAWLRLSADELTAYFASIRDSGPGATDLWTATRADLQSPFGTPSVLANVSTVADETTPFVTHDGLRIYFIRGPSAQTDIWRAVRSELDASFSDAQVLLPNAMDPVETPDGRELWYIAGSPLQLFVALLVDGGVGPGSAVSPTATWTDRAPVWSWDGKLLYFASTRSPALATSVFVAPRSGSGLGAPTYLPELGSATYQQFPSWVSPDGCRMYLMRYQGGQFRFYLARRSPR